MVQQYKMLHELEQRFDRVVETSQKLIEVYRNNMGAAWALHSPTPDEAWLRQVLLDFWYEDEQDGRATRTYVGLVAANQTVLSAVAEVNTAKEHFAATISQIKAVDKRLLADVKLTLAQRHPALNSNLRGSGLTRLHLKQCWRHIPVAEQPLERVRFAWYTSGRSIRKITVQEAESMLLRLDTEAPHVRIQLRALAGIPSSEPLAQVQTQAPVMRANLFYQDPLPDGRPRRAMNVALPLFVPSEDGQLPRYNQPAPFPPEARTRAVRSDERLEQEPFLSSIRAFRYKTPAAVSA
ncbi:DNA replication terminus site-binding protein [Halomonas sp. McH1-25]|uniref:DNA replication terminus site-binding protein n=1 Tax=unclassified Halomonas TaxID=2609666 RepID=UPI001EF632F9|nr:MULTISPECIES: DNA replication terminus site-binding protein [unclassified Halomonas]MCG7602116.1 DNA replication terminus site-binding protein [Halomonas sp. McH1-25]MCP1343034.1 DNA replication terminus site-binding protein [Halomonas sp. FL8]MCP1362979.1 DNA replication terminus site-binding protein [Halomonas sp. BBD45]MCP1364953.1 DNA replication terminus site-binding protein [Halomonas sp. BBD48]